MIVVFAASPSGSIYPSGAFTSAISYSPTSSFTSILPFSSVVYFCNSLDGNVAFDDCSRVYLLLSIFSAEYPTISVATSISLILLSASVVFSATSVLSIVNSAPAKGTFTSSSKPVS